MSFNPLKMFSRRCLGIDIGSSSVKVVELSKFGKKIKLENYVQFQIAAIGSSTLRMFSPETFLLLDEKVAKILKILFRRAKIKEKKTGISLPDFSTFFTVFQLPPMPEKEITKAVEFEAHRHIPLPLSEVNFDWEIIEKETVSSISSRPKVLLVAVPNKVIQQYQRMITLTELQLEGLEAEVFSLIRGALGPENKEGVVCLVDFGWQTTTLNIAEKGFLKQSVTVEVSGEKLTRRLADHFKISPEQAELVKQKYGLNPQKKEVREILKPEIDRLAQEIKKNSEAFFQKEGKKVEKVILAGGSVDLPYLREELEKYLGKKVMIADPFSNIAYPSSLKARLKQIGPSLCVALGVALRGLEG